LQINLRYAQNTILVSYSLTGFLFDNIAHTHTKQTVLIELMIYKELPSHHAQMNWLYYWKDNLYSMVNNITSTK